MSNVKNITDGSFESEVLQSDIPVLIDFWAEWCGPCKVLGPVIDEVSDELSDVKFTKLNIDENPETPSKYGIMSIPTLLLFKEGKLISTQVGLQQKNDLKAWIENHT